MCYSIRHTQSNLTKSELLNLRTIVKFKLDLFYFGAANYLTWWNFEVLTDG